MDEELKQLLKEDLEISKENNDLLKKLWTNVKLSRTIKFLYWAIIIAITLGAYYYIQPYIDKLIEVYSGFGEISSGLQNLPEVQQIGSLFGR